MKKGLIIFIAAVAVVVLAIVGAVYWVNSGNYVATVDGEKLTKTEYNFFLKYTKKQLQELNVVADWKQDKVGNENAEDYAKNLAWKSAVDYKVQLLKAKETNVKLTADEEKKVDDTFEEYVQQNGKAALEKKLKDEFNVSLEEYKAIQKNYEVIEKFKRLEQNKIKPASDDIDKYYSKSPEIFKEASFRSNGDEAVWIRHILVMTKDANQQDLPADKQAEAKKKAEALLARAKNGEDFAKLAKENSEDTGSAQFGGDYVFSKNTGMAPEFEKAAFELKVGEVSELVKTTFGYHILKLEEKIEKDKPVSLKCAKEYREYGDLLVKDKKYQELLETWKKDPKYEPVRNEKVYNSIDITKI